MDAETLRNAILRGADLCCANLHGADLQGAILRGADLQGADLRGVKGPWQNHTVLAEILWVAAGKDPLRRMVAALVGRAADWCWDDFLTLELPSGLAAVREWALDVFAEFAADDDETVPAAVRLRMKKETNR